jgi:hypothetical protein
MMIGLCSGDLPAELIEDVAHDFLRRLIMARGARSLYTG